MAVDEPRVPPGFEPYADEPQSGVPPGSPGKDGRLDLRFAPDADGRTRLVRDIARVPFHVSGTLDHGPHPDATTVCVQSPTGGVGSGDRYAAAVVVREGGVAHVTTGSATKVLSMEAGYAAAETSLTVGADAHLDHVPEPTILHAGSRYAGDLTLTVDRDASAVLREVVVPGRLARGERFAFDRFRSRVRARRPDGSLLFEDATVLTPGDDTAVDSTAPGMLGEFAVVGTLFVVAPSADAVPLSDTLHDRATGVTATDGSTPVRAGATALPNGAGVLVRAVGDGATPVRRALRGTWDAARRELIDAPAPRRRAV
jgi:urease accessory protein